MSMIQHSSRSDEWHTPPDILEDVRKVLGGIHLDPASSITANRMVMSENIYTRDDNGLLQDWTGSSSIYLNPPGGKLGSRSLAIEFWKKLMVTKGIGHAIFMGFTLEHLASSQGKGVKSMLEFPICIPQRRIKFLKNGTEGKIQPTHSNVIVYVPGTIDNTEKFIELFSKYGATIPPAATESTLGEDK